MREGFDMIDKWIINNCLLIAFDNVLLMQLIDFLLMLLQSWLIRNKIQTVLLISKFILFWIKDLIMEVLVSIDIQQPPVPVISDPAAISDFRN